ncbi:MAG: ABC transporter permease subunit [Coriobacteriia bacterium]
MSWTLLRGTLHQRRWGLFWYCVGLATYGGYMAYFYPSIAKVDLDQFLKAIPSELYRFMAGSSVSFNTFGGFLATEYTGFMWVLIAGAAIIAYAARTFGGEVEAGTMELLLSMPVSRVSLAFTRIVGLVVVDAAVVASSFVPIWLVARDQRVEFTPAHLWVLGGVGFLLMLLLGAFALAVSSVTRGSGVSAGVTGGVVAAMWLMHFLRDVADWADVFEPVNIFKYWDPARLVEKGTAAPETWWVLAVSSVVLMAVSVVAFSRRDVT